MSKTVKLSDDAYLDSSSVSYDKTNLKTILNVQEISITFNEDYIYSNDLEYICVKMGKLVILNINTISFKKIIPNFQALIYSLPKPNKFITFYLYGGNSSRGLTLRLSLTTDGIIQTHWSEDVDYGNSSDKQYGGILVYKTVE